MTLKSILKFWFPLFTMWLLMSLEGPFLTALIARLSEPKLNLAAYGVAFSFALILEAPIIMLMSATTALVRGRQSFLRMRRFTIVLNIIITIATVVFVIPPVFDLIAIEWIGLPAKIASLTYSATVALIPWPAAIGIRRFYQGVLIRGGKTKSVAYGTMYRLVGMSAVGVWGFLFTTIDGSTIGGLALSVGVVTEAVAVRYFVRDKILWLMSIEEEAETVPSYKEISYFYYPLALQSLITLGLQPLVTFFVGRGKLPIESLAVMPVIGGIVFLFRCIGLSCNEVIISLMGDNYEGAASLRKFTLILGCLSTVIFFLIAYTPLSQVWFESIAGLSEQLSEFATIPLMIMITIPPLALAVSWQRSVCVVLKKTIYITYATSVEVGFTIGILAILINGNWFNGAISACLALAVGRVSGWLYLTIWGPKLVLK